MGLPVEVNPLFLENQYAIQRSLRFRSSATAFLTRTPGVAGSSTTYTWSGWVKLGYFNVGYLMSATGNSGYRMTGWYLRGLGGSGALEFEHFDGTTTYNLTTSAVFRDPSSWYHIIIAVDSTQGTNTNRTKIYVNGVQQTVTGTYLGSSTSTYINTTNIQSVGRSNNTSAGSGGYFDGYMSEVNFIDGYPTGTTSGTWASDNIATLFGQYNEFGVWSPRKYGGSYGTNGFYLPFNDPTSATTLCYDRQLGYTDTSKNNWTPNNISVTAGTTYDAMTDVPPPSTIQNVRAGNYCVFNPLMTSANSTVSDGNLATTATAGAAYKTTTASLGVSSGKWYWECYISALGGNRATFIGIVKDITTPLATFPGNTASSYGYEPFSGSKYNNGTGTAYGNTFTTGDTISVALDLDNGKLWWAKNGTWQASGDPAAGTNAAYTSLSGTFFAIVSLYDSGDKIIANFGQRPFSYTPPSGFRPLNSNNLPAPTIPNGAKVMAATLYTGDGSASRSISNQTNSGANFNQVPMKPDLVWFKSRNNAISHRVFDVLRNNSDTLVTNSANAESTGWTNDFQGYNNDGFTVGTGTGLNLNTNTYTMVAWQWQAGTAPTVNNTAGAGNVPTAGSVKINGADSTSALAGSIAATRLSANTIAGFSVVTYTGNGTAGATVPHGLGATPSMVIVKPRVIVDNWNVYHASNGATPATQVLYLNLTNATSTNATIWNNTAPTSSVFSIGTNTGINTNGSTYVAYCWTPIAGYSSMGSYTGNGSADGPFVYTGFRPRWILIKRTDAVNDWYIQDTSTNTYNVIGNTLLPNSSAAEASYTLLDALSNGFKLRNTFTSHNASGGTYIYAAFAESPFKFALSR